MARLAAFLVALAGVPFLAQAAGAQALARLHVRSMVATTDASSVRLGDMLRLVLRVRVGERVGRLDNVTLPDLTGFDVLGDERRCVGVRGGTDCTEILSLAPTVAGTRTIGPVTLDAVDARSGRPTRFASNPVRVAVLPAQGAAGAGLLRAAGNALRIVIILILVGIAAAALVWGFRRRKRAGPVAPPPFAPPAVRGAVDAPRDEDVRFRTAVDHLRARPSRARVDAVRGMLRERVGAHPGETFADLAARGAQFEEPSAMEALRLIERAAFIDDEDLPSAVVDALPALESIAGMKRVGG